MNKKTLEQIDFYRIKETISGFCITEEGKKSLNEREPLTDENKIENLKHLSFEWQKYFSVSSQNPVLLWEPIFSLFKIIKTTGASLTLEQVRALGSFTLSVKNVKKCIELKETELDFKYLNTEVQKLVDFSQTESKIFRIIDNNGNLRDLPEILQIRKQIASLNAKIKNIMQKFTSDTKFVNVLESNVPVLRNGRQVLAVKSNMQNRIPGIIHEVSSSSLTVYIEPEESVLCSNELIQKESELIAAIKKILTDLTFELQPSIPFFKNNLPIMCLLDSTQAAAKWGIENNCCYALNCKNEPPFLLSARHPLLGEKAVPIDIRFMEQKKVLIITGPNTGGKTVTLKTFSLFAMLNQTGFPLPAKEGTRLPIFTNIFADIGDDQSLDQSLSTFSGHMKNIAQAVQNADSKSLILLDELGSGTDPQEGTAISMAVLDELIEKKSFVLVTTHQGILKNYGYTNSSCVNASVEFNQNTLSPSYHLLMGLPGESHALDIARKNGLPTKICDNAKKYIATEQADVSALIRGLNRKHIELNKIQKIAEQKENDVTIKYEKLKEKELKLLRKENELKKGKQQELNDFLIHSRKTLENLVRTLKEGEVTREKTLEVKKYINQLTTDIEKSEQKIEKETEKLLEKEKLFETEKKQKSINLQNKKTKKKLSNKEALENAKSVFEYQKENEDSSKNLNSQKNLKNQEKLSFSEGAFVIIGENQTEGKLISQVKKGVWQVQVGSIKMNVKQNSLRLIQKENVFTPSVSVDLVSDNENEITEKKSTLPVFELRLLGMYSDQAIKSLERQIDLCILHNFPHFSVIHGKGDGVLQQAVKDYLSHCPSVKSFEFAPAEDGGAGKTYVTLQ